MIIREQFYLTLFLVLFSQILFGFSQETDEAEDALVFESVVVFYSDFFDQSVYAGDKETLMVDVDFKNGSPDQSSRTGRIDILNDLNLQHFEYKSFSECKFLVGLTPLPQEGEDQAESESCTKYHGSAMLVLQKPEKINSSTYSLEAELFTTYSRELYNVTLVKESGKWVVKKNVLLSYEAS